MKKKIFIVISSRYYFKYILLKSFKQLEKLRDLKKLFSIELPKTWNTNFYYDSLQSSIYTADTTKQLTETLLLDITIIKQNIKFDNAFKFLKKKTYAV